MEKPRIKEIIENIESIIDIESVNVSYILNLFLCYLKKIAVREDFIALCEPEVLLKFRENFKFIELNASDLLPEEKNKEITISLWRFHDSLSGQQRAIVRLLITGLVTEKDAIEYSQYPEYVTGDLLALVVSCFMELNISYAEEFEVFSKEYILPNKC